MKKLLLIVLLIVLALPYESLAFLRAGLKGGVNLAKIESDEESFDYQRKPGFIIGAMAEVPISPNGDLAVRGELLYVQKGSDFTVLGLDGDVNTDELVVAPFLVFRLPIPKITPFLQAGPELGFNTAAKQDFMGSEENIGADWKNNNVGLNVGAGIAFPVGPSDLTVDFRYNLGLTDMSVGGGSAKTKTNGIQLLLGYNFFKI